MPEFGKDLTYEALGCRMLRVGIWTKALLSSTHKRHPVFLSLVNLYTFLRVALYTTFCNI